MIDRQFDAQRAFSFRAPTSGLAQAGPGEPKTGFSTASTILKKADLCVLLYLTLLPALTAIPLEMLSQEGERGCRKGSKVNHLEKPKLAVHQIRASHV
jgi:hypothetical protein